MREDLLGYLLGALDADEQCRIEGELANNPRLRLALERLRQCLEPLESVHEAADVEPPAGLAQRVCDAIDAYAAECRPTPRSLLRARSAAAVRLRRYSASDGIVLSLVVLAAFTLILPALANSRYQARKAACQDNLRVLGEGLLGYSVREPGQRFPLVPISGSRSFAGVFAPVLFEYEMIGPEGSQVICPGPELAVDDTRWSVPTLREIDQAEKSVLQYLQDRAGGSYAYCVGYVENGRLQAVKNLNRSNFALLSDAPSYYLPDRRSANHGGRGQNVYYEDGHYAFVTDLRFAPGSDDPWRNRDGFAEAGKDRFDSVVLPSGMRPIVDAETIPVIAPSQHTYR
jgi:hypothetical protein